MQRGHRLEFLRSATGFAFRPVQSQAIHTSHIEPWLQSQCYRVLTARNMITFRVETCRLSTFFPKQQRRGLPLSHPQLATSLGVGTRNSVLRYTQGAQNNLATEYVFSSEFELGSSFQGPAPQLGSLGSDTRAGGPTCFVRGSHAKHAAAGTSKTGSSAEEKKQRYFGGLRGAPLF